MEPKAYGSWPSRIDAQQLIAQSLRLAEPKIDGDYQYWLESRPAEGGRNCLVRAVPGGAATDVTPDPINVRTRANEYGGGAYCVADGLVFFVAADDQRIYRLDSRAPAPIPEPVTAENSCCYADLLYDAKRQRLITICEDHSAPGEAKTTVISIDLNDRSTLTLAEGADFYSSPVLSPCGNYLALLFWNHPAMPWADNNCLVLSLNSDGSCAQQKVAAGRHAGQPAQALFQPQWHSDGRLLLVSDLDNWWRFYWLDWQSQPTKLKPLMNKPPEATEFATPQWVFGLSTWGFINANEILAIGTCEGRDYLYRIALDTGHWRRLDSQWTDLSAIACPACTSANQSALLLAANYSTASGLVSWRAGQWAAVRTIDSDLPQESLSSPQAIRFGPQGEQAHGFYYPPHNGVNKGLPSEQPPLITLAHGGPTSRTSTALNIKIQYWCSRGFAVVDVNYRGSTGYGRAYRQALDGNWGVADVDDVCRGAEYLVAQGLADADRLAIKGGSAGGYTVLSALTFRNVFSAGASLYGIGDLEALVRDTHKFESRYLDTLVAPYPEQQPLYQTRSPIHSVGQLNCPVIFFQGGEDRVVPPNQAKVMVEALTEKGIPVAYVMFPNEGHGFRQGENIVRAIEAELYFYSRVFGFDVAADIDPVHIRNL